MKKIYHGVSSSVKHKRPHSFVLVCNYRANPATVKAKPTHEDTMNEDDCNSVGEAVPPTSVVGAVGVITGEATGDEVTPLATGGMVTTSNGVGEPMSLGMSLGKSLGGSET